MYTLLNLISYDEDCTGHEGALNLNDEPCLIERSLEIKEKLTSQG